MRELIELLKECPPDAFLSASGAEVFGVERCDLGGLIIINVDMEAFAFADR